MTKPGVQKPHCEPWQSTIACCTGCSAAVGGLQVLDGEQLAAVERRHELDAGIDRAVVEPVAVGLGRRPRCRRRSRPRCSLPWCRCGARSSRSQSSTVWVGSTRSSSTSSWPRRKRTLSRMEVHPTPLPGPLQPHASAPWVVAAAAARASLLLAIPLKKSVEHHRGDRREQDARFEQRMQLVRQLLEEVRRHQRDHAEADRERDHEQVVAVGPEVDGSAGCALRWPRPCRT